MNVINKIKNNKFVFVVFIAYLFLAVSMPSRALESVKNSSYYIKEMLLIMPVILLLTSLIEAWVPKKSIQNALGKNSGIRGYFFSFLLGSFSAGPIYAAFPICKMLFGKGASISNLVIILSTWAVIKVPMLANEAKFLGVQFMIIRWVLTTISIFAMAYIVSKLVKEKDIPMNNLEINFGDDLIYIDQDYCIGCGICEKVAPNHFKLIDKKAEIISQVIESDDIDKIKQAVEKCPANVIHENIS